MPIIFAQAITVCATYLTQSESLQQNEFLQSLSDFNGLHTMCYSFL